MSEIHCSSNCLPHLESTAPAAKKRKVEPTSNGKLTASQKDNAAAEEAVDEEDKDVVDSADPTAKASDEGGPAAAAKRHVAGTVPKEASLAEVGDDKS